MIRLHALSWLGTCKGVNWTVGGTTRSRQHPRIKIGYSWHTEKVWSTLHLGLYDPGSSYLFNLFSCFTNPITPNIGFERQRSSLIAEEIYDEIVLHDSSDNVARTFRLWVKSKSFKIMDIPALVVSNTLNCRTSKEGGGGAKRGAQRGGGGGASGEGPTFLRVLIPTGNIWGIRNGSMFQLATNTFCIVESFIIGSDPFADGTLLWHVLVFTDGSPICESQSIHILNSFMIVLHTETVLHMESLKQKYVLKPL